MKRPTGTQVGIARMLMAGVLGLALAHPSSNADGDAAPAVNVADAMRRSFEDKGQATLARLEQDETQALCTQYSGRALPQPIAASISASNRATIRAPRDGQYFGDVSRGEAIAQSGSGLQSNDVPGQPAGGNCYACHEMSGTELAYGTIGPSLRQYGKLRGTSAAVLEYTWGKLYNSNAHMPCSLMPRFGHRGILTEQQLKDVMSLLFDPASPVNQ